MVRSGLLKKFSRGDLLLRLRFAGVNNRDLAARAIRSSSFSRPRLARQRLSPHLGPRGAFDAGVSLN